MIAKNMIECVHSVKYTGTSKKIFFKYPCGFRLGLRSQHCLISMTEKWKKSVDNSKGFTPLLTDLPKTFDCLPYDLIIAKLNACGFSLSTSRLIHSCLSNRKQRTRINSAYSSWEEIFFGVPQCFILGPLLFNIFICDLLPMLKT